MDQVFERDIDLLLLEELLTSQEFPSFLAEVVFGGAHAYKLISAWNSVTETVFGESDLVAVFQSPREQMGLLIENKIRANFMPQQAERYRMRGEEGRKKIWWDRFKTCLLAPERYLSGSEGEHYFDYRISYESLFPYFRRSELGLRGRWRLSVLEQACAGSAVPNWTMVPDATVSRFFVDYWDIANRRYPELRLKRQDQRPGRSTWIYFGNCGLPRGVSLVHKAAQGASCDLAFRQLDVETLAARAQTLLEPDMRVVATGKSASVRIDTPTLDVFRSFDEQREGAISGLEAAKRLLAFFQTYGQRLLGSSDQVERGRGRRRRT